MSATDTSSDWYECDHCGDYHPSHTFYDAAMCSLECRRKADAESILNELEHDHTVCGTCFCSLKVIEKPPQRAPDVAVGYQYRTQHAARGEKSPSKDPDVEPDTPSLAQQVYAYEVQDEDADEIREYYPGRKFDYANEPESVSANDPVWTGTICAECGNTEHNSDDDDLRSSSSRMLAGYHLTERVRELDKEIDEAAFWDAYAEADTSIRGALEVAVA